MFYWNEITLHCLFISDVEDLSKEGLTEVRIAHLHSSSLTYLINKIRHYALDFYNVNIVYLKQWIYLVQHKAKQVRVF